MAAEMASGDGGGGLGPRRLRRKRCGVRRDRVENGTWPEIDAGAAAEGRRRRRSVVIAAAGAFEWRGTGTPGTGIFHTGLQRSGPPKRHQTRPNHRHTTTQRSQSTGLETRGKFLGCVEGGELGMAAAAAALTLASPLRRLLRAPGVVSEPYYFITRGKPERPSYSSIFASPLTLGPPAPQGDVAPPFPSPPQQPGTRQRKGAWTGMQPRKSGTFWIW